MTAYEQGFMGKCAEYGIDPEWLIKNASKADVAKAFFSNMRRLSRSGSSAVSKGAKTLSKMSPEVAGNAKFERILPSSKDLVMSRLYGMPTDAKVFAQANPEMMRRIREITKAESGMTRIAPSARDIANARANGWINLGDSLQMYESPTLRRLAEAKGMADAGKKMTSSVKAAVPPKVKVVGKDAVQPRKGGLPPYNPQEAATRGINVSPYGTVTGYGGDIPLFSMYGNTAGAAAQGLPAAAAAQGLPAAAPAASSAGGGSRWPWLSSKWDRMVELLGGGNANARAISEGRRRARVLENWLANGTRSVEAGSAGHARLASRASRRLGQTNADISRRLQNGGREELNKVLAARLGVGGAGALGIAGTGAALSSGDNYTQQVPEPWQTWGNV